MDCTCPKKTSILIRRARSSEFSHISGKRDFVATTGPPRGSSGRPMLQDHESQFRPWPSHTRDQVSSRGLQSTDEGGSASNPSHDDIVAIASANLPQLVSYAQTVGSCSRDEAMDLVQGFVADRMLAPGFAQRWLRSSLSLRRWIMNGLLFFVLERRRGEARRRAVHVPIDTAEDASMPKCADGVPDGDSEWARRIVSESAREASEICRTRGLSDHWTIFFQRFVLGRSVACISEEFGLSRRQVADRSREAAKHFRAVLKRRLAQSGAGRPEAAASIHDLLDLLQGDRKGDSWRTGPADQQ